MSIALSELGRGRPLILLADRNPLIRKVVHTMLIAKGFRVLLAPTVETALKVITRLARHLDLIIVEAAMSVSAGFDLFERVSRISPRLPVLVMSSQLGEPDQPPSTTKDYIGKPFTQRLLLQKICFLITGSTLPVPGLYKTASLGH
jgi:DNA-binding response OmpR family regulator